MFSFKILGGKNSFRKGVIKTNHGVINTPNFTPVATQGAIKSLTSKDLQEIGLECLLANAYHLYLRPGEKVIKRFGGLHKYINWRKPILTDSGGFQVFSLSKIVEEINEEKVCFRSHLDQSKQIFTPEKSIQIQKDLGADIIFTFDECVPFESDYATAKRALERTNSWTLRCLKAFKNKNNQSLFGIIQGGRFKDLREKSVRFISSLGFSGFGLGGFFDAKKETLKVLKLALKELPKDKPRHLLGIGSIDGIFNAVELGIDLFDCVLPTRLSRVGYIFVKPPFGNRENKFRFRITNHQFKEDKKPLDKNCSCSVCQNYSRAYLRHLFKAKELSAYSLATFHNLWFFNDLMKEIRKSIEENRFKELKKKWLR